MIGDFNLVSQIKLSICFVLLKVELYVFVSKDFTSRNFALVAESIYSTVN